MLFLLLPLLLIGTASSNNKPKLITKKIALNKKRSVSSWGNPEIWPNTFIRHNGYLPLDIRSLIIEGKVPPFNNKKEITNTLGAPTTQIKVGGKEILVYEYSEEYSDSFKIEWKGWMRLQFRLDNKGKILDVKAYKGFNRYLFKQ